MKLITFYLPQFHEIPENGKWWGKGFTEWVNVKKAKSLFCGHMQPRVPLDGNYYDLSDKTVMEKQMKLAAKYGIGGFCFYHYWFNGKKVLEKPVEELLKNKRAKLPFCLAWANEPWTKTWHGAKGEKEVLLRQQYGGPKEWEEHFNYLLPFFQDKRYIKKENRPIMLIYKTGDIPKCNEMLKLWDQLAKEAGFDGMFTLRMLSYRSKEAVSSYISGSVDFEPGKWRRIQQNEEGIMENLRQTLFQMSFARYLTDRFILKTIHYDRVNRQMLLEKHKKNQFRGVFVDYDDSPRRGRNGLITKGSTPKKFEYYLTKQMEASEKEGNDLLFINAWNEWGESNYLEPDERYGYGYLHGVRNALLKHYKRKGEKSYGKR